MATIATRLTSSGTYFVNGNFDEVNGAVPTNGLVLQLDAGQLESYSPASTSTWRDLSSYRNNLSLVSNVAAYDSSAESINFNNVAYATTSSNSLNGLVTNSTDFSVSVWFNYNSTASYTAIFEKQSSVGGSVARMDIGYGANVFYWTGWNHLTTTVNDLTFTTPIAAGTWYHTVLTCTGSTKTAYINGTSVATAAVPTSWPDATNPIAVSGKLRPLNGRIAAAQVYNRALTATEVRQLYNATAPRFNYAKLVAPAVSASRVTTSTVYAPSFDETTGAVITNGLVAYIDAGKPSSYPGTGISITDLSNPSVNATISGNITFVNSGTASYFNFTTTTDTTYITSAISQAYVDCTVVFQPDFTQFGGANLAGLIAVNTNSSTADKSLRFRNVAGPGSTWSLLSTGLDGNDWITTATNTATYYLNGVGTSTVSISSGWNVVGVNRTNIVNFPSTFPYYIGSGSYPGRGYQGKIAAVLMYNRPLSAAEQQQNYNYFAARYGLTPIAKPPAKRETTTTLFVNDIFDEITGAPVVDNSLVLWLDAAQLASYPGSGSTWTSIASLSTSTSLFTSTFTRSVGGAIQFDGVSTYADLVVPGLSAATTCTVEVYCKPYALTPGKMFFGWTGYDIYTSGAVIGFNTGASDQYGIGSTATAALNIVGTWTHFSFVMRNNITYPSVPYTDNKIYVNGISQPLVQISATQTSSTRSFSNGIMRLAGWPNDTSYRMNMDLAVFKVYNRELTADEIQQNYNATKRRFT